jgi:release factor glutamine methyltransferase
MTIGAWLSDATKELVDAGIDSARLDAEIILAHTLRKKRTYVHAHTSDDLPLRLENIATARLDLRRERVPLAYITGHKEFYGRLFTVSPQVLVPRPESEEIITLLRKKLGDTSILPGIESKRLVDIGTGSGCLGITAKLLYPELDVTLLDTSKAALAVSEKNAELLGASVMTMQSDLLSDYPFSPDIVLANLPYVGDTWERSPETNNEPADALFAANDGLALIEKCFEQLSHRMKSGGISIFEADPRQWPAITRIATDNGFHTAEAGQFAYCFTKS